MGEARQIRGELTRLALAQVLRVRIAAKRLRQTDVARSSGISRTYLLSLLGAKKQVSLFVFLELSRGLGFEDEREFMHAVLQERDKLRQIRLRGGTPQ